MKKIRNLSWQKPPELWRQKKFLSLISFSFYYLTSCLPPHVQSRAKKTGQALGTWSLCARCFSVCFLMAEEQETNIKVQPQLYSHHSAKDDLSFAGTKQDLYSLGNVSAS